MHSRVTRGGRITIPKPVRDRLGIVPGSVVDFDFTPDGRVALIPHAAEKPKSRFEVLRGRAGPNLSTNAIMAMTRGDDDGDDDLDGVYEDLNCLPDPVNRR